VTVRYHLGCGEHRLVGWINADIRPTGATDVVVDLSRPELSAAEACFSSAFFEHLRRRDRTIHLRAVHESLTSDGFVCYLGMPDFRAIARLYLDQGPGIVGPVFDLYNVYRYTHGDPEGAADTPEEYLAQLHKSLFDVEEIRRLLRDAGFPSHVVFSYVFSGEPEPVSLGFYATKEQMASEELQTRARRFLADFDRLFLESNSIKFIGSSSRSAWRARLEASRTRRAVRRVAWGLAVRLARV
jgi:predicted SAM-dependent methyltransferase